MWHGMAGEQELVLWTFISNRGRAKPAGSPHVWEEHTHVYCSSGRGGGLSSKQLTYMRKSRTLRDRAGP